MSMCLCKIPHMPNHKIFFSSHAGRCTNLWWVENVYYLSHYILCRSDLGRDEAIFMITIFLKSYSPWSSSSTAGCLSTHIHIKSFQIYRDELVERHERWSILKCLFSHCLDVTKICGETFTTQYCNAFLKDNKSFHIRFWSASPRCHLLQFVKSE